MLDNSGQSVFGSAAAVVVNIAIFTQVQDSNFSFLRNFTEFSHETRIIVHTANNNNDK